MKHASFSAKYFEQRAVLIKVVYFTGPAYTSHHQRPFRGSLSYFNLIENCLCIAQKASKQAPHVLAQLAKQEG